jgi:hypothetical protein
MVNWSTFRVENMSSMALCVDFNTATLIRKSAKIFLWRAVKFAEGRRILFSVRMAPIGKSMTAIRAASGSSGLVGCAKNTEPMGHLAKDGDLLEVRFGKVLVRGGGIRIGDALNADQGNIGASHGGGDSKI